MQFLNEFTQQMICQKNKHITLKSRLFLYLLILLNMFQMSCNNTLQCERHFIPNNFIGKVTIYFNQKNGQREFDKNGCIVYKISEDGKCYTSLPYKQGSAYPNITYQYFELTNTDSLNQIFEFYENEFLKDTISNKEKRYIFYHSSGFSAPNYTFEYYVDFGENYKKYLFY